jgi:hypothetical protein
MCGIKLITTRHSWTLRCSGWLRKRKSFIAR